MVKCASLERADAIHSKLEEGSGTRAHGAGREHHPTADGADEFLDANCQRQQLRRASLLLQCQRLVLLWARQIMKALRVAAYGAHAQWDDQRWYLAR
jgi:hypothetical protein